MNLVIVNHNGGVDLEVVIMAAKSGPPITKKTDK